MLPLLYKQDESFNHDRLFECVDCVSRSKWIEERQPERERNNNLMDTVQEKLIIHLKELQLSTRYLELDLDHPDHLEQGRKIIVHLDKMRPLEEIIPEMTKYRKETSAQLEYALRATLSCIEEEYSLEKKGVSYQEEVKQNLMKLKLYADSLRQANAYLEEKDFQNEEELDVKIKVIEQELIDSGRILEDKMQQFEKDKSVIDNKLKKLKENKTNYRDLNTGGNFLSRRPLQAATDYLSEHHFTSIEEVNEQEMKEKENQKRIESEEKKFQDSQEEKIEKLKQTLENNQQIKREYQRLRDRENEKLKAASDFLKPKYSESEIERL